MADNLKAGDEVLLNGTSEPNMVILKIVQSDPQVATCVYFNKLTATFAWFDFPIACLTKKP